MFWAVCSTNTSLAFTCEAARLHTPPILPPDLEQRIRDLPERAAAHRIDEHFEHVLIVDHRLLQAEEHGAGLVLVPRLEVAQAFQLALRFLFGRADQLDLLRRVAGSGSSLAGQG